MNQPLRYLGMAVVAGAVLALSAPAFAGVTCSIIPSMCPPSTNPDQHHSVPEPGTLGLLAVGAAAGVARLRRKRNKKP